jgi:hypothetical protein
METIELSKKSRILKALVGGYSCEQILADERTLTYHDIFHAIAEAPTSYWRKNSAGTPSQTWSDDANSVRKPASCRID